KDWHLCFYRGNYFCDSSLAKSCFDAGNICCRSCNVVVVFEATKYFAAGNLAHGARRFNRMGAADCLASRTASWARILYVPVGIFAKSLELSGLGQRYLFGCALN